jgi:hypothetical protein
MHSSHTTVPKERVRLSLEPWQITSHLSLDNCLQALISIDSICKRDPQRNQLNITAIQNISYILKQIRTKMNGKNYFWVGFEFNAIFDSCVNYLKTVNPDLIWICSYKPYYYENKEWTFGKFTCYAKNKNPGEQKAYQFDNVKHDTTVEKAVEMITSSRSAFVRVLGYPNDIFQGPLLSWWAPDVSTYNKEDCASLCQNESRYGSVRLTIPLRNLLQHIKDHDQGVLRFYALGTREYPRERCHSLMISRKQRGLLVGWGDDYEEQNCDDNHELIRHLNTVHKAEWICYYTSDQLYDQLDFAIELGGGSLKFTSTSNLRFSFVDHTSYCNRLKRPLTSGDPCYATRNKAMQDFVDKLVGGGIQLLDLRGFFDNETFNELIELSNLQQCQFDYD